MMVGVGGITIVVSPEGVGRAAMVATIMVRAIIRWLIPMMVGVGGITIRVSQNVSMRRATTLERASMVVVGTTVIVGASMVRAAVMIGGSEASGVRRACMMVGGAP